MSEWFAVLVMTPTYCLIMMKFNKKSIVSVARVDIGYKR